MNALELINMCDMTRFCVCDMIADAARGFVTGIWRVMRNREESSTMCLVWMCWSWLKLWYDQMMMWFYAWISRALSTRCEWVMSHMWMSHAARAYLPCYTWMSRVAHTDELCHIYLRCSQSHVSHMNEEAGRALRSTSNQSSKPCEVAQYP